MLSASQSLRGVGRPTLAAFLTEKSSLAIPLLHFGQTSAPWNARSGERPEKAFSGRLRAQEPLDQPGFCLVRGFVPN